VEIIIQNKYGNFPLIRALLIIVPLAVYFYGKAWGAF